MLIFSPLLFFRIYYLFVIYLSFIICLCLLALSYLVFPLFLRFFPKHFPDILSSFFPLLYFLSITSTPHINYAYNPHRQTDTLDVFLLFLPLSRWWVITTHSHPHHSRWRYPHPHSRLARSFSTLTHSTHSRFVHICIGGCGCYGRACVRASAWVRVRACMQYKPLNHVKNIMTPQTGSLPVQWWHMCTYMHTHTSMHLHDFSTTLLNVIQRFIQIGKKGK